MSEIKFVSYDGKYPCLCDGVLVLDIEGKERKLINVLYPGEGAGIAYNWDGDSKVYKGAWKVPIESLPEDIKKYAGEIEDLANENIAPPCCGGCL